jgi:hypothetical protein
LLRALRSSNFSCEMIGGKVKFSVIDGIVERLVGIACMSGAVVEAVRPEYLEISMAHGLGLGMFGFLIATGRSDAAIQAIKRAVSEKE